jgi:hypothetical protein
MPFTMCSSINRIFPRILKIFLAFILFIQELDPFFYLKSSKILFHESQIFYLESS